MLDGKPETLSIPGNMQTYLGSMAHYPTHLLLHTHATAQATAPAVDFVSAAGSSRRKSGLHIGGNVSKSKKTHGYHTHLHTNVSIIPSLSPDVARVAFWLLLLKVCNDF